VQEERLDYLLYYAATAIKDEIKNPSFSEKVIALAKQSPNQTTNLLQLSNELPLIASEAISKLEEQRGEISSRIGLDIRSLEDIDEHLVHAHPRNNISRKYDLSIFVPNLDNLDPKMQPIFSPNIPVDEEKHPEIE